ncbi:MAG: hypothetical protein MJB14_16915 [Spirochaetes bacterium]|nr:hypothetical protein [Spirochaetota bacterium]
MTHRYQYYIQFPNGDRQPVYHLLNKNDLVDINGKIIEQLDLRQITYRVKKIQVKKSDFIIIIYHLKMLNRFEVEKAKKKRVELEEKSKKKIDKVYQDLEKKTIRNKEKKKR